MEQRSRQDFSGMFPRPGPALKGLLITVAASTALMAIVVNWMPGGALGALIFDFVACARDLMFTGIPHLWTLLTAGLFTRPTGHGAAQDFIWSLFGLYVFSTDLERRWGGVRFLRFVAVSIVTGFVLALLVDYIAPDHLRIFHPPVMFGTGAAIVATTVAWSRQNADRHFLFFFFVPMRGKWLFWLAVLYCFLGVLFWDPNTDSGVVAPFGGIVTGLLLGGSPSAVRAMYLRAKLALMRKHSGTRRSGAPKPARSTREGGPPLRVVYGGMEDELKKRKPPKDKRYLN